jgi:CheY-like chemotaxis protein
VVCVIDSGVGVEPERRQEIFEMFTTSTDPMVSSQRGMGVGLPFARKLVAMHGGSIDVESAGVGHGAEFTVRLPLNDADDPARPRRSAPPQAAPRRVLIVDDNADGATALASLLAIDGHTVETVHDGPSALDRLSEFPAHVVLLDIGLPGLSGYEVARRIRQLPGGTQIYLVAITGWGMERDRARASEAGIDHHLSKPVSIGTIRRLFTQLPVATPSTNLRPSRTS